MRLNYQKAGAENQTLTAGELQTCRPVRTGDHLRAFCPFHGSDKQRSLSVYVLTGRFCCFSCGTWGYMEDAREKWAKERRSAALPGLRKPRMAAGSPMERRIPLPPKAAIEPALPNLAEILDRYQQALQPGSIGARYLEQRGIPLGLAKRYGIGYASGGTWAHRSRQGSRLGRLIFPHTDPAGALVNLYGRAVELDGLAVAKDDRHDHLPGSKGYFNAPVLRSSSEPVFITEGPMDALSLIAAGHTQAVAIFGVVGWRWEWARSLRKMVLAFDADDSGESARESWAQSAVIRGIAVATLSRTEYGGCKDANEAWTAGCLNVGEWPADRNSPESVMPLGEPAGPCRRCGGLAYWRMDGEWRCMACVPADDRAVERLYLPGGDDTLFDCGPLPG